MKTPWIPFSQTIPQGFETERLRLRPLTVHDAVKDYDAVMSSRAELWELFGPGSNWPAESLTLEQDIIDLAWHRRNFRSIVRSPTPWWRPTNRAYWAVCTCFRRPGAVAMRRFFIGYAARSWGAA